MRSAAKGECYEPVEWEDDVQIFPITAAGFDSRWRQPLKEGGRVRPAPKLTYTRNPYYEAQRRALARLAFMSVRQVESEKSEISTSGVVSRISKRARFESWLRLRLHRRHHAVYEVGSLVASAWVLCAALCVTQEPRLVPVLVGLAFLTWALAAFVDSVLRGRAVVDLRLATMAILIGLAGAAMGAISLARGQ